MNDDGALTISSSQEEEKEEKISKMNIFIPVLALTVAGVGTFWYYHEPKKSTEEQQRPRMLSPFKRL